MKIEIVEKNGKYAVRTKWFGLWQYHGYDGWSLIPEYWHSKETAIREFEHIKNYFEERRKEKIAKPLVIKSEDIT